MARDLEISLIEWPAGGRDHGGPKLLGRITDPDLVEAVRERIAQARRLELEELDGEEVSES